MVETAIAVWVLTLVFGLWRRVRSRNGAFGAERAINSGTVEVARSGERVVRLALQYALRVPALAG